ncbi:MAG: RNB domain-containing ribonuclease, partial [Hydrogenobacter sp.]
MAHGHITEEEVLNLLKSSNKPMHFEQIVKYFGLDKEGRKKLKKILRALKKEGRLFVEKGRYRLTQEDIVVGTVIPYPAGFGFLHVGEDRKDIYIPPFEMTKVFGGDLVKAKVVEFRGKKEVRILKVIKRGKKELVCKIVKGKTCFGIPIYDAPHQKILLSQNSCKDLKKDTLVVVEIKEYPKERAPAKGVIKEVLGHPQEKLLIIDLLIRKYDLPLEYPQEVIREAQKIHVNIKKELKRRKDLRDQVCFTIDPEKAKDFDDAVAIEMTPEGHYRLWVHIADVSYFVKEGSHIDKEAFRRGFTFYLPDRALHMLPEKLSADL